MKIASYLRDGEPGYGVIREGDRGARIVPPGPAFRTAFPSLRAVLEGQALDRLGDDTREERDAFGLHEVRLLPPLPDAGKIVCVGINYPKRHPIEGLVPPPEQIIIFGKYGETLVGHGAPLMLPPAPACDTFDYEGELVLVIGKPGRHIAKAEAFDHIAGYTIMNDGSVRDWQKHSVQAGKNFTASGACGPWMVTADEIAEKIGEVGALALTTRLNGDVVQATTAAEMIFDIPAILAYLSTIMELRPGDLIATGSPEGSGASRSPQRFLTVGDRLEVEWSGIGVLSNRVEAEPPGR